MLFRRVVGQHEIASTEYGADSVVARLPDLGLRVVGERQQRVEDDDQRPILPGRWSLITPQAVHYRSLDHNT